ncbi:protein POOR HOMOLOGOUS SYNAPSIS 1 isoform X1 [Cryptomeria japonica]|uniref:protein POOR HOMOLOGOUS SYNAPSIS 1 isoform X1 n=1 Tax=Cryptomeria japonica TaxID=3369 RepID=UPI0025ACFAEC|nr:protein POOR HOMOLOGOUS SYNAPSIS 1 isoform X1 [Cryptomeria japonica]
MAIALRESCSCTCSGNEWKVKLAQYVPRPRLCTNNTNICPFKILFKPHFPANGTWISSNSPAILVISTANSATKLHVILHGKIHEEHFISRLKFSWPQTPCQARFGSRGSRVVFACYNQESLHKGFERSKFALLFDTAFHARDFLSSVKNYGTVECSLLENDTLQADELPQAEEEIPRSMLPWDESSASQTLAIYKPQIREKFDGVPSDEANKQKQKISSTVKVDHSQKISEKKEILNQVESICLDLPPKFSSYFEESYITAHTKTDGGKMELPHNLDANLSAVEDTTEDLKAQVAACFMDPSFQDFVSKVEKVWGELDIEL